MTALRKIPNSRLWELGKSMPGSNPSGFLPRLWDFEAIGNALGRCRQSRAVQDSKSLHSLLVKCGSCRDVYFMNNLISLYATLGLLQDARQLFYEMPHKNVVSWTTAIAMCTRAGGPEEALKIFTQMLNCGQEVPNGHTLSAALKACTVVGDLELGKWIHRHIMGVELQEDTVLMNAALDMYVKCGCLCEAQRLFDGIPAPNSTSWNILIAGYAEEGEMDEAEELFCQMPQPDAVSYNTVIAGFAQSGSLKASEYVYRMHAEGIRLDQFTFPCALKACGSLGSEIMGKQIHCYAIKLASESDCLARSALIDMYGRCGIVDEARKLYNQYSKHGRPGFDMLAITNSMISGFAGNGYNDSALDLVLEIHHSGVSLDAFTLSSALKVCINLQNLKIGRQIHALVVVGGYHLDYIVGSVLVDLYLECESLEKAFILFHGLPHKDIVAWGGLIAGCIQHGSNHLAFSLFREMINSNFEVDHFILSSVLKSCSSLAGIDGGKQVHAYSIKRGFDMESAMQTSLIDMYSKCGEIEDGLAVFRTATERDTLCWTAIIVGCGQNGREKEAIELFRYMLTSGAEPNEITFLGVLSACRHAGLVEDACSFFNAVRDEHGLTPCLEHYCCMVDILGRAGLIKEALRLINDMPYEPDETIWNSFIGACGSHSNADISKHVAEHLQLVASCNTSMFVALSNAYASLGMWDISTELRNMISRMDTKEAGMSWVEVRS